MMVVLPFVGVWEGLRRLWRGLRAFSLRGLFTLWRGKAEGKKGGEVEDVVENLVVETDDAVQIHVTISSPSIRTTFSDQPAVSTPNEPSTPTPKTAANRRASLLPTPQEITAYTLSSPQTLRRAVHQAREIFSDSQRRDAGKKRGEGDLVRGMMKKRVGDLEEKRGKALTGTSVSALAVTGGKKAAKTVAPVTSVPGKASSSSAAEDSTAPKPRTVKPAKSTAEKRSAAAVPPAARATAARGRTRLIGRPIQPVNAAQSSSSQSASTGEQSVMAPLAVKAQPRSGTRALSARDSLLTRNSGFAMQGQVPPRDVPAQVGTSSTMPGVALATGSASMTREVPSHTANPREAPAPVGITSTAQAAREVPAVGGMSAAQNVPAPVGSSSTGRNVSSNIASTSAARDVSSDVANSSTASAATRKGSNVRASGLGAQVPPAVPYGYVAWPGQPGQYPGQGMHGPVGYGYPTGMRYVARDNPAPYPYPVQLAQSGLPAGVVPKRSLLDVSTMPPHPPVREPVVQNASSTTRGKPPARLNLAPQPAQPTQPAHSVRPAQPAVPKDPVTIATPVVQKNPSARDDVVENGSSPSTQATTSATAIEGNLSSSTAVPTPADSVQDDSHMSPVIAELEPPASSGSGFGLGFGDVAGRRSTSVANSDDARTRRADVVPGGYPSVASASPVLAPKQPEPTSGTVPIHKLTGYTRPSSFASADRESSLKSAETLAAAPAIQATPAASARPSLRKNNSLGLVTTLESMRSPSMEPTSTFTQVGSFESKHSPFFGQQTAFPSRLRAQAATEPVVTTTVRTSHQAPLDIQVPADMERSSSKGVFIPVMPLPDMTPATSPVAQRHVSFITHSPETANPTPALEATETTAAAVDKQDDVAKAKKQDEPMSPPKSPVAKAQESVPSPERRMRSDAEEASPLTSIASLDHDDDDRPGPSSKSLTRARRPEVPRRATRAMRPVIAKPLGVKERVVRKAVRASGESSVESATSSAARLTRRELPTRSTVGGISNGVRPAVTSEPLSTASTPTVEGREERALDKGTNDRKRKEPPQSSVLSQARVIPTRISGLEVRAQRAVRPVLPATVHTRTEFALPEGIIADVTPVRRTRASAGLDDGTTLPRGSPTKKRRISERALASQSSVELETNASEPLVRRRSRRMQPKENA